MWIAACAAADSQLAYNAHEVVHFFVRGRFAGFEVLLHADAGKEGQDHFRQRRRVHCGLRGFDISGDQISESGAALANDVLRRGREHRELVHGIYRETAFLAVHAAGRELQKALDVFPAERLGGQEFFPLPFSQVVTQTLEIQISLVGELGIEAGLVYACGLFQFLKGSIREAVFPEDRHGLLEHALTAEVLWPSHDFIMTY